MTKPAFIPGLELSARFYNEAVCPILNKYTPHLAYAAALIGSGSEVLGFDDEMSSDHHWGPRVMLFLRPEEMPLANDIQATLANELPHTFLGYPTNFSEPNPEDHGTQLLTETHNGPVNHRVEIATIPGFFQNYLGFDPCQEPEPIDWLTFPQQKLRTIRAGAVFHDEIGLKKTRKRFADYPRDVWLYLLAAGWARIGQEEHLMGRAGIRGDELGSALIGSRLVRDIMRLCFLMEREYAPYPKWFGTAFQRLAGADEFSPHLLQAVHAPTWQEREANLVPAYEALARMHNRLGLTDPLPETATQFWGRPFRVIAFHGFADRLQEQIKDEALKTIPLIGSIDLFSDNTDLLEAASLREKIKVLYRGNHA